MKPHWKRYATIALAALVASLLIWGTLQGRRREGEQEAQRQKALDDLRHKVTDFAEGRGAVTDWQKELGDRSSGLGLYTADLQPKLVRADGRPIFFYGRLLDIETGVDGYVVRFKSKPRALAEVDFSLVCGSKEAAELLKHRSELFSVYAVIAQIGDVHIDQSHPQEDVEKVFLATGRCVDVMPTGAVGYSLSASWGLAK
jgi:hypothetical protein